MRNYLQEAKTTYKICKVVIQSTINKEAKNIDISLDYLNKKMNRQMISLEDQQHFIGAQCYRLKQENKEVELAIAKLVKRVENLEKELGDYF